MRARLLYATWSHFFRRLFLEKLLREAWFNPVILDLRILLLEEEEYSSDFDMDFKELIDFITFIQAKATLRANIFIHDISDEEVVDYSHSHLTI